jgi:hypothetical protein
MTELDDRLARLAERRTASAPLPREIKHKHPAALSRVVVASLSWCVFATIVAAFALQAPAGATKMSAPVVPLYTVPNTARTARRAAHTTPTTIVIKKRRHIVYVDQHGAPLTTSPTTAPVQYHAPVATWPIAPGRAATPAPTAAATVATHAPTPAPTPAPVATHAPPPASPPPKVTPTTTPQAPPPPPPPPCAGSKCP